MCIGLVFSGILGLAVAAGGAAPETSGMTASRLREIALIYVESYETTRRFEEYALENRDLKTNVLADDAYYESVFGTNALDVRGALVAELLADLRFPDTRFFRVYSSTMSPPHPVFIIGVKTNGSILRFRGFPDDDFDFMIQGSNAGRRKSLDSTIRLYYRLLTPFDPGPILDDRTMRDASRVLAKALEGKSALKELFLPVFEKSAVSTTVSLCVFDSASTRLEIHRIRIGADGQWTILEQRVVHDKKKIVY